MRFTAKSVFAALAALGRHRKPPTPPHVLAAGRKRRARERQRAATARRWAAHSAAWAATRTWGLTDRIVVAMEPGGWYGRGDLIRLGGVARNSRGIANQMMDRGLLERQPNPDYRYQQSPQEIMGGEDPQPMWLYRLTEAGGMKRAVLMACPPLGRAG